ncbi:MAG: tetratricopeptide repeat protein [Bacteroidales bacterium]|nr:tetratricopeptide repeat protein [Bacteroidales bacterium]
MKKIFLIILSFFLFLPFWAQEESRNVRKGNKFYDKEKYVDAEIEYRKGLEKNRNSFSGMFNLGNSLYRQGKYAEAAQQFQQALSQVESTDKKKRSVIYHNLGNSLLKVYETGPDSIKSKALNGSIESYKQSLRNNPNDDETRTNLAYAQTLLQQMQQQQQNQQQKQEQQEQQDKQEQQQQEKQQEQKQEQEDSPQQQNPEQMSKENAEQILEAMLQDEKDVQEKVKKQAIQSKHYNVSKDW